MPTLHIIIPFYNERATLGPCLERVVAAPLPAGWGRALTLVNDCSRDGSGDVAAELVGGLATQGISAALLHHPVNRGKGAALQTGFDHVLTVAAPDDLIIIQDADLEYDPNDYAALLAPLISGEAAVVFGTRWGRHALTEGLWRKVHALGNRVLTGFSNLLTGHRVSDMECCYKVFTVSALRTIRPRLTEQRFGIEPQIAAAVARHRLKLVERPVTYAPREVAEGKKIRARDGFRAFWVMVRERFRR